MEFLITELNGCKYLLEPETTMCGIFGVLCFCPCVKLSYDGLNQLLNRGYDSVGMCTITPRSNKFLITKFASGENKPAIEKLQDHLHLHNQESYVSICHSRWSTHGSPTDANAHPHCAGIFSIVHNGIIENYQELKDTFPGYAWQSQTDTEVIVKLIQSEFEKLTANEIYPQNQQGIAQFVQFAILSTVAKLRGTYALAVLCSQTPDYMYCIKRTNPLIIGLSERLAMISSEKSAFLGKVQKQIILDDNNLFVLHRDTNSDKISYTSQRTSFQEFIVEGAIVSTTIGEFPHWTLKEIHEQSASIERALEGRLCGVDQVELKGLGRFVTELSSVKHLVLLGCGTSLHAAMIAERYFKEFCNFVTVTTFDGAEFEVSDFPRPLDSKEKIACLMYSQSGETQDLLRCIPIARSLGAYTIGVINVEGSLITLHDDCHVYLKAEREVAVASTKSFTSQLTVSMLMSLWFSRLQQTNYAKRVTCIRELHELPCRVAETIELCEKLCPQLIKYFKKWTSCFVLGKGTGEALALEGALKIKEISYIHAEGKSASSLKHGPFALLQPGFPVVLVALDNEYFVKCLNTLEELKSRQATVIFITNTTVKPTKADYVIQVPSDTKYTGDVLVSIPLQMLAYCLSIARGLNPDFPRNLAKVVTVE